MSLSPNPFSPFLNFIKRDELVKYLANHLFKNKQQKNCSERRRRNGFQEKRREDIMHWAEGLNWVAP